MVEMPELGFLYYYCLIILKPTEGVRSVIFWGHCYDFSFVITPWGISFVHMGSWVDSSISLIP